MESYIFKSENEGSCQAAINNLKKKTVPTEIERTSNIRKQQHRFFLSLSMRTNRKCNNSHAFCFLTEPNIPEGPKYERHINTSSMPGEKFYQLHAESTTATSKLRGAFGKFLAWSIISVTDLQTLSCLVLFQRPIFLLCYDTNFTRIL